MRHDNFDLNDLMRETFMAVVVVSARGDDGVRHDDDQWSMSSFVIKDCTVYMCGSLDRHSDLGESSMITWMLELNGE